MGCDLPIIKSQSEIMGELSSLAGEDDFTDSELIAAINQALGSWSIRVKSCFCFVVERDYCEDSCTITLPCCGLGDVQLEVAQDDCIDDDCWARVEDWRQSDCDEIIVRRDLIGKIRVTAWVTNPVLQLADLSLAKSFKYDDPDTDTSLWIQGRVNLPAAGWVKVCDDWVQYGCMEHDRIPSRPVRAIDTMPSLDPDILWPVEDAAGEPVTYPIGVLDPEDSIDIECMPGVHTHIKNVDQSCRDEAGNTHLVGTPVEIGLAAQDHQAFTALLAEASAHLYRSQMRLCTSAADRRFYAELMQMYMGMASDAWLGFMPARKPRMKVRSVRRDFNDQRNRVRNSYWVVGGRRYSD